jgi:Group 4 capsule polysaccharide lipoprotein gfcB, YjbF
MMAPRVEQHGHLRKLGLAAGLALGLAGCSSTGDNSFQRMGALAKDSIMGSNEVVAQPELTRAQLNEIPSATIALSLGDGPRTFLVPLADNGGYLNYLDAGGRGIVMLGGAVTGTQSLGQDLEAVRQQQDDPIARPTPAAAWPDQVTRDYQFAQRSGVEYSITLSCVFEPLVNETIEIVEIEFDVVRISEICTNARRQIVNTYWVEPETGFIWKSQQWLGPYLEQATIEIIRPYGG